MQEYVGRGGAVLTVATSTLKETLPAAEHALFGLVAKEIEDEEAPDPDADAALPAAAAHLLVENAVAPMPVAPLPFTDDAEYHAFAEDRRRSRTTTVVF